MEFDTTEVLQKCPSVYLHLANIRVLLRGWNDLRVDSRLHGGYHRKN